MGDQTKDTDEEKIMHSEVKRGIEMPHIEPRCGKSEEVTPNLDLQLDTERFWNYDSRYSMVA